MNPLENFLVGELFAIFLIFCRVGTAIMMMPGVGETFVQMRIRLLFSLGVSYILAQVMYQDLPELPGTVPETFLLLSGEILVGGFIGLLTKILLSTLHTTGMVIASMSSLASSMLFDPTQGGQSASVGIFLTITAITLLFAIDMHHVMLGAFVDTYSLMIPGEAPMMQDMANYIAMLVGKSFAVGIQLASPVIAFSMLTYLGAGLLSRLMPQMQVFFVLIPIQLGVSFFVIMTTLTAVMLWFTEHFKETMGSFLDF